MKSENEAVKVLAELLKNELLTFECPYCDRPILFKDIFENHERAMLMFAIYYSTIICMHRVYESKEDRPDDLIILEILLQKITANPNNRLEPLVKDERLIQGVKATFRKCLEEM